MLVWPRQVQVIINMQKETSVNHLVSIIVPAYNEKKFIANCLQSVLSVNVNRPYGIEIIVIDNGSTDNTAEIARKFTDKVYTNNRANVSAARNYGASLSKGDLLVFLDADVRLTDGWGDALLENIKIIVEKTILTGARYIVREDPSWLEANWFEPLSKKKVDYINGGNILLSRATFNQIGGFDELLETGEDYEFSVRARRNKVAVVVNPQFVAIHDGYPSTLKNFFQREIWHGKGDYSTLKSFLFSKVAISATLFGTLHLVLLISLFYLPLSWGVSIIFFILAIVLLMSYKIFRSSGPGKVIINIPLCYLYLMARFFSVKAVLLDKLSS